MEFYFKKRAFLVVGIFVCLIFDSTEGHFHDDEEVVRGDKFIDDLLRDMLQENGDDFDPYFLDNMVIGFSKKILFVNVSGEATFHNGFLIGLKSLHRPDHCTVKEKDGKLYVAADLGVGGLDVYYDGTMKFMNYGPTLKLHGYLAYAEIHMEFDVDATTGRHGNLGKFYVDEIKGMTIFITGLGPMTWSLTYLVDGATKMFHSYVQRSIENKIRNHIAERLPNYQFPAMGIVTEEPEASEATNLAALGNTRIVTNGGG